MKKTLAVTHSELFISTKKENKRISALLSFRTDKKWFCDLPRAWAGGVSAAANAGPWAGLLQRWAVLIGLWAGHIPE